MSNAEAVRTISSREPLEREIRDPLDDIRASEDREGATPALSDPPDRTRYPECSLCGNAGWRDHG